MAVENPDKRPLYQPNQEKFSPTQRLFLKRYHYLLIQQNDFQKHLPQNDWRIKLIHRALYSTYIDCQELGVLSEVKEIAKRN